MNTLFSISKISALLTLALLTANLAFAATAVLQRGYTPDVAGANLTETVLTPANVTPGNFGRLFSLPVDGNIYAQPLYQPNLNIGGVNHNVLFVATMKDNVYAFDADNPGAPLWAVSYANIIPGSRPVPAFNPGATNTDSIVGPSGILSTPVIDPNSNSLYFVTAAIEADNIVYRLHAVDTRSGAEKFGGPAVITGNVTAGGNRIDFVPRYHAQRPALALANGHVIIAFASHDDWGAFYGWVMSYDAATLAQTGVLNPAATADHGAGIWQSGRPPVVDGNGYVYFITGNGIGSAANPNTADGINNFAESVIKLDPHDLHVVDYFTTYLYDFLDVHDLDMSSSGPTLIPGSNVLIGGGKTGWLFLLDSQNLGHLQDNDAGALQAQAFSAGEIVGGPVVWGRSDAAGGALIYNWSESDALNVWAYDKQRRSIGSAPVATASTQQQRYPGGILALSANGDGQGILWALLNSQGDADARLPPGELRAIDAADVTKVLWNSAANPARDDFGLLAKFVPPVVADGKVFVATASNQVVVYGLLPNNGGATVTAWPPRQPALGGAASYLVKALDAAGAELKANWSVSGLPTGAAGVFQTDAHGRTYLRVSVSAATPSGSYRLFATATVNSQAASQAILLEVGDEATAVAAAAKADSQASPHLAKVAIDGNSNTYWKSLDTAPAADYPHSITLDLGSVKPVAGLSYLPRQDGCVDGTAMQYEVYLSTDNVNWLTQTTGGSFDYGPAWRSYACDSQTFPQVQQISFPVTNARYVKLNALNSVIDGAPWASAAEVKVYVAKINASVSGDYVLATFYDGMVLDVYGQAPASGIGITASQQFYAALGDQQWRLSAAPTPGYYRLSSLSGIAAGQDLALEAAGGSTADGAGLDQWTWSGGAHQQFAFNPVSDGSGSYRISNLNSGLCLDVQNGSYDAGAAIDQKPCYNDLNRRWWLTPANPAIP